MSTDPIHAKASEIAAVIAAPPASWEAGDYALLTLALLVAVASLAYLVRKMHRNPMLDGGIASFVIVLLAIAAPVVIDYRVTARVPWSSDAAATIRTRLCGELVAIHRGRPELWVSRADAVTVSRGCGGDVLAEITPNIAR